MMQILSKHVRVRNLKVVALAAVTATVVGCSSGSDFKDLNAFMTEVEKRPQGRIEPLPPFEQVPPFAYQASTMRSPFEPPITVRAPNRPSGPKVKPDPNRRKQFLEQYTIANLTMVGTLSQGAETFALVQDADGGVHRVRAGDYMGTDHGRIEAIEEGAIELVEIVPDGTGGWVERSRTVSLGGGEKG